MSESPRFTLDSLRRSSLARSISSSGSPGSSPDLSSTILPRFVTPDRNNESPNTSPGSSPNPSSAFPHFISPFKKGESIDLGPPVTPFPPSAIPKRLSVQFTGDSLRKPSVAEFHGDLKAAQTRVARRKLGMKIAAFLSLFLLGLMSGMAIGLWGIPYAKQMSRDPISISAESFEQGSNKIKDTTENSAAAVTYWQPKAGTTFQIQLSKVMTSTTGLPAEIQAYDVDLFDTPASIISGLHNAGKKVICYFSAGTAEDWRSDFNKFQKADLGAEMEDWEGEFWLHTPNANVRSIMVSRLQLAKAKGCDGVDPDNVDVYGFGSDSGFNDLTQATAVDYLTFLAGQAHSMGLAIGLKNAGEIIPKIQPVLQWVVTEQCADYNECGIYKPFAAAGKPVFNIQYPFANNNKKTTVTDAMKAKYCNGGSKVPGFTNVMKHMNLDSWVFNC